MPDIKLNNASNRFKNLYTHISREREEYYQNRNFTTTTTHNIVININNSRSNLL